MTEELQSQGDSLKDNGEVNSLNSHHSEHSISGKNSNTDDERGDHTENADTSSELTSPASDSVRERGSTITKKIPLSEYATLQGILAHQVDEGAPCLKCGPDVCSGLDLHFWKKVCKNCGCPRGSHKIQRVIEEKKEVPRSILLQTADEDEEDYKELEIAAPPSRTTINRKSDKQDYNKYNEEYIAKLREFYKSKTATLNLPEDKKLSEEQLLILQEYINQTQGQEVVSPEVLQNHLHLLTRSSAGSADHLDVSDNSDLRRSLSSNSVNSDSSDLPLHFLQALQLVQLNKNLVGENAEPGHEILPDPAQNAAMPRQNAPTRHTPTTEDRSYDSQVNEEEEATRNSSNKNGRRNENSTIEMIDRLTDVSRINNTETVIKNRGARESDYSEDSSDSESHQQAAPPKPLRRNPGSFDDLTQGDIVDYYTTVSPSGEYPGSATLQRKGSPGVWVPPGIDHNLVKQYLAALPEDKRPVNTLGVQWRIKQLQTQLPRYDHNINYCHEMSPEEQEELFMFVESRKEKAQGQGEVKSFKKKSKKKCDKCGGLVDCAVIADKIPGRVWHPGCFSCTTCEEVLVDLIYFQYDGRLYCGRHHAELLRPRCHACDELIFGQEFITADKHEYHKEHFCCWECDTGLGGAKYVSHKGQPYCQGCYEKLFCTRCVTCREPIGAGAPLFKHGALRWHGNPQCYACSFCKTSLVNRTFMPTERYVYCSKNCYRCHESLRKTKGK
ncbi:hypothetical protein ACHWQZ_G009603 [Mnemiopsis leidyi]